MFYVASSELYGGYSSISLGYVALCAGEIEIREDDGKLVWT